INCAARARPRSTLTTNPANTDDPNSGTGRANVSETVNANSTTSTSAHSPDAQRAPCTARAASPRISSPSPGSRNAPVSSRPTVTMPAKSARILAVGRPHPVTRPGSGKPAGTSPGGSPPIYMAATNTSAVTSPVPSAQRMSPGSDLAAVLVMTLSPRPEQQESRQNDTR